MAGAWRALLLVAGVAVMVCVAQRQSYEEIVTQALRVFNYGRLGKPLFRLLEVTPRPGSVSAHGPRRGSWEPLPAAACGAAGRRECLAQPPVPD